MVLEISLKTGNQGGKFLMKLGFLVFDFVELKKFGRKL